MVAPALAGGAGRVQQVAFGDKRLQAIITALHFWLTNAIKPLGLALLSRLVASRLLTAVETNLNFSTRLHCCAGIAIFPMAVKGSCGYHTHRRRAFV